MTEPSSPTEPLTTSGLDDLAHYAGILEAVVAVLAIKCGLDPNTMMARAIEDITEQTNMETVDTERIIRARWTGRNLSASTMVSQMLPDQLGPKAAVAPETPEAKTMAQRLAEYQNRQSEGKSDTVSPET